MKYSILIFLNGYPKNINKQFLGILASSHELIFVLSKQNFLKNGTTLKVEGKIEHINSFVAEMANEKFKKHLEYL